MKSIGIPALLSALLFAPVVLCDEIVAVDKASLSGSGAPAYQDFTVPKFDDLGGILHLKAVTLDLLTSTVGGYTTDGSGTPVHIISSLTADYYRDRTLLAQTQALIDQVVDNPAGQPPTAFHVFDTDHVVETLIDPGELAYWIGTGDLTLTAFTELFVEETPPGIIFFGAGGSVYYTLIYTFDYALSADGDTISVATGGQVVFSLDAGPSNAGRNYLLLGSFSGSDPGIPLPNGGATLPLVWDAFTDFMIPRLNGPIFTGFVMPLDGNGQGTASLHCPTLNPSKIGKVMTYAYCLEGAPDWDYVSNPVAVEFIP